MKSCLNDKFFHVIVQIYSTAFLHSPAFKTGWQVKQSGAACTGAGASFAIDLYLKPPLVVLPLLKVRCTASVCDRDGLGTVARERRMMRF